MLIVVTNRHLCQDFLMQLERIARCRPGAVILREKDLPESEYQKLAQDCAGICVRYGVPLIVHSFVEVAQSMGMTEIHFSFVDFCAFCGRKELAESPDFPELPGKQRIPEAFSRVGVSVHSVAEAVMAEACGASYVVAGHVFATDSKKWLEPRGVAFLADVCGAVRIPVYAIGGITPRNARDVMGCGAADVCVMSSLMRAEEPERLVAEYMQTK
ncbi:MAG: thiamine phosphate synthase [Peptococcaceae bacterium]|nr:thiamine phosphate synthase [Peptococcaceae bacterium]